MLFEDAYVDVSLPGPLIMGAGANFPTEVGLETVAACVDGYGPPA